MLTAKKLSSLEDQLHEEAIARTGLTDFGDPSYREGMRAMLHAFDTDMELSNSGREFVYHFYFLGPLISRLYTEKGWAEHPEALDTPIKRPLIIVGPPRTGTTALHKLLSMDPQLQGLELWLGLMPIVRPAAGSPEMQAAYRLGDETVRMIHAHMPGLAPAHNYATDDVEMCKIAMSQSFMRTEIAALLPSYDRWYQEQDLRKSYRRYEKVLRLIGSGAPERRWLLKDPYHMLELGALFDAFPDACILRTQRDPLQFIPSTCSVLYTIEAAFHGENARPEVIGPRESTIWRMALERAEAARRKRPEQFFDVDHRKFTADPMGLLRSIYEKFDLPFTPEAEQRFAGWIAASPTTALGPHKYGIEDWGITADQIREIFRDYREQYRYE